VDVKVGLQVRKSNTDSHEAEETKKDMKERYVNLSSSTSHENISLTKSGKLNRYGPSQLRLAVRMPVWVGVPLSKVTDRALKNRSDILLAANIPDVIPTAADDLDPIVRIHVDYLDEDKHLEYR
jgi:hypothetical protein